MKVFQIPAALEGFTLHKDGGAAIRFVTGELKGEDILTIKEFYGQFGFVLFKENEFAQEDIPQEDAGIEGKTPSQRLRNVLFVLYKQGQQDLSIPKDIIFDEFYRQKMEGFLEHLKAKIKP